MGDLMAYLPLKRAFSPGMERYPCKPFALNRGHHKWMLIITRYASLQQKSAVRQFDVTLEATSAPPSVITKRHVGRPRNALLWCSNPGCRVDIMNILARGRGCSL